MAVDVEVRLVAVHAFADVIGQPADRQNVAGAVEGESVIGAQALAGKNLGVNRPEPGIVSLKWMHAWTSL